MKISPEADLEKELIFFKTRKHLEEYLALYLPSSEIRVKLQDFSIFDTIIEVNMCMHLCCLYCIL